MEGSQTQCLLLVLFSTHKNKRDIITQNQLWRMKQKQTVIYGSALIKRTAGVADFLTRWEKIRLLRAAPACKSLSHHLATQAELSEKNKWSH